MTSGIYQIKNLVNGKVYIGSAIDIKKRWALHEFQLKNNIHHSKYLQNSWNKHGEEFFVFEVIELIRNEEELLSREQYWMDFSQCYVSDNGYNVISKAGSHLGVKRSEESKLKMSIAQKNKVMPESAKKKLSEINKGKTLSEETKNKISEKLTGKKHSEETKKKMSEAKTGIVYSDERNAKLSVSLTGKKRPQEVKDKISKSTRGESNGNAKLTEEIVKKIKLMLKENIPNFVIAEELNLKPYVISDIKLGRRWKHVII